MARWTWSVQPTCTPGVGLCARSVPSWAFIGARSAKAPGAGVPMRRGAPAHPASTQHIVELRDQGPTWNDVGTSPSTSCSAVTTPKTRQMRLQHRFAPLSNLVVIVSRMLISSGPGSMRTR